MLSTGTKDLMKKGSLLRKQCVSSMFVFNTLSMLHTQHGFQSLNGFHV